MKFLTVGYYTDAYSTLSPAEKTRMQVESLNYLQNMKQKYGSKFMFYMVPGWNRHYSISEFDTIEEYYQSLQSPIAMAGYYDYESYPLMELDEKAMSAAMKALKQPVAV